jgi:hypothetical protein
VLTTLEQALDESTPQTLLPELVSVLAARTAPAGALTTT